jgi:hypothetical protein
MYDFKSNLVLGFHGCEAAVREELLSQPDRIKFSKKPFEWLGHGFYFWENNEERAWKWAFEKKSRGDIAEPAVIGAVLQLGYCCDLLDSSYIDLLSNYYNTMAESYLSTGTPLPVNKDSRADIYKDKLLRYLDCAVIEYMHAKLLKRINDDKNAEGHTKFRIFDSVRGAFFEGGPAFEGSGIISKTHIQICIRNPNCIQGFFKPKKDRNYKDWLQTIHPD